MKNSIIWFGGTFICLFIGLLIWFQQSSEMEELQEYKLNGIPDTATITKLSSQKLKKIKSYQVGISFSITKDKKNIKTEEIKETNSITKDKKDVNTEEIKENNQIDKNTNDKVSKSLDEQMAELAKSLDEQLAESSKASKKRWENFGKMNFSINVITTEIRAHVGVELFNSLNIGQEVDILYLESDPENKVILKESISQSRLDQIDFRKTIAYITFGLAGFFLILGFIFRNGKKQE